MLIVQNRFVSRRSGAAWMKQYWTERPPVSEAREPRHPVVFRGGLFEARDRTWPEGSTRKDPRYQSISPNEERCRRGWIPPPFRTPFFRRGGRPPPFPPPFFGDTT